MTDVQVEFERAIAAELTDEDIERDKLRLGIDLASKAQEYFSTATPEVIRNFAASYGDDNPLFADPARATRTRWGGQIAPPIMAGILNAPLLGDPIAADINARTRGVYRGIHAFVSGGTWEWFQPVRPGDTIYSSDGLESVEVRPSSFAGRAVHRVTRQVKFNQRGEVVGVYRMLTVYTERKTARDKGKYADIEPASYTDEDLERIAAIYEAEQPRGVEPRHWEDVAIGEPLPSMVKGPLTVTDIIVFHAGGYGFHPYGLRTGRLADRNRRRIPAFYIKNELGIPDVAQRVHWDSAWANAIGNPMAYDYSVLRECWMQHYLTDWAGDDGWIIRQQNQMRKFNYIGDTTYWSGKVTGKRIDGDQRVVDLEITATSQRGDVTVIGTASISLPSREHGPAGLPEAPVGMRQTAARLLDRHHELMTEAVS
jgi:acyl dehydratase